MDFFSNYSYFYYSLTWFLSPSSISSLFSMSFLSTESLSNEKNCCSLFSLIVSSDSIINSSSFIPSNSWLAGDLFSSESYAFFSGIFSFTLKSSSILFLFNSESINKLSHYVLESFYSSSLILSILSFCQKLGWLLNSFNSCSRDSGSY